MAVATDFVERLDLKYGNTKNNVLQESIVE